MFARRDPPELPPCLTCRVELVTCNVEVAEVFRLVRNQIITVADGRPVDLSIPAVMQVMELRGVRDRQTCLERVLMLWHHVEGERRRKTDAR